MSVHVVGVLRRGATAIFVQCPADVAGDVGAMLNAGADALELLDRVLEWVEYSDHTLAAFPEWAEFRARAAALERAVLNRYPAP